MFSSLWDFLQESTEQFIGHIPQKLGWAPTGQKK